MINFHNFDKNIKRHNPHWPEIPDHPYMIIILEGSCFGKAN